MFTLEEIEESMKEIHALEEEIKRIDAVYESVRKQLPEEVNTGKRPKNEVLDGLMAEAVKKAEAEGRQRAALYRDSHSNSPDLEKPDVGSRRRRGVIV